MSSWDWAALPHNILDEILDKLVNLPDYIRFASVCVSWRSAALDDRNHRGKKNQLRPSYLDSDHQLPMLMVHHWTLQNKAQFYSVTHEKILNFQLRVPFYNKRFIGSSFGWLISVDTDFMVTLFNPFSVTSVFLPPVLSSDVRSLDDGYYDINYFNHEYYFVKAILSADPVLHPDEYVVMLIYGDRRTFAFIRPGPGGAGPAPCWRYLELSLHGFCDVIYSKSRNLFYAVCETGEVCSIDINKEKADCFTPTLKIAHPRDLRYIVETRSGDLLQVQRLLRESLGYRCRTGEIKVFKLEKTTSTTPVCYWAELKSLGDNVLFVGDSTSLCVVASDFPGCRPGSVYFSQPFVRGLVVKVKPLCDCMDIDMGVANIEGKSVEPFQIRYENDVFNIIRDIPPIWVVPTFERGKQDPKFILCIED